MMEYGRIMGGFHFFWGSGGSPIAGWFTQSCPARQLWHLLRLNPQRAGSCSVVNPSGTPRFDDLWNKKGTCQRHKFVVFVYHISPHYWTANLHFLVLLLNTIAAICRWMAGNIESSGSCLHKSASIWRFSCDRALLQRLHPFVLHAMWILDD